MSHHANLRFSTLRLLVWVVALAGLVALVALAPPSLGASTMGLSIPVEIAQATQILINGIDPVDLSGIRVDTGDLNADGIPDLVIGARQADPEGRDEAGETYVLFGPLAPGTLELATAADVTIYGIDPGDHSGIAVAVGDLNADEVADLVIGARRADPDGREDAGEAYVLFGPVYGGTYELADLADVTLNGIDPLDETGVGAAVGDLNGDGQNDLVVGARQADPPGRDDAGETYIVFGPLSAGTIELATGADVVLDGAAAGDLSGYGLDTGDLNDDGALDLIVGAWAADGAGMVDAGETYVLFGPLDAPTYDLDVDADILLTGAAEEDHLGVGAAAGDINLDGYDDLMIGATTADPPGRIDAGVAYVSYGPFAPGAYSIADLADVTVYGVDDSDYFGIGVGSGDIDDDGLPDLIFGAFRADPHGKFNAGQTYVVLGRQADLSLQVGVGNAAGNPAQTQVYELLVTNAGPDPAVNTVARQELPPEATFVAASPASCAYAAAAHQVTCPLGVVDADEALTVSVTVTAPPLTEMISPVEIASRSGDPDLDNNAVVSTAVMPPTCLGLAATVFGTEANDLLAGTTANDIIHGLGGNDYLVGDQGDDLLCGGDGDDVVRGDAGSDLVVGGAGNDRLAGGDQDDWLLGGPGNDAMIGGNGSDTFICGPGVDYANGGAAPDVVGPDCEIVINP